MRRESDDEKFVKRRAKITAGCRWETGSTLRKKRCPVCVRSNVEVL
jgi:hypothetical protein